MHLFFTNLHRRHSIRPNEIFKIHNTLRNPLTHTIPKLKSFSIRLKSLEANIKSHRQKIFQPPFLLFFFYRRITLFHLTPSNIQSLHPSIRKFTSINFHLGGKRFRSSSNSNSLPLALPKKNKLHSFLPQSRIQTKPPPEQRHAISRDRFPSKTICVAIPGRRVSGINWRVGKGGWKASSKFH